jgi:ABC-type phosphate/phosphonate transport system substrate-binding protein
MKKSYLFVSLIMAAVMLLTACGTAATPTAAPLPTATQAPAVPVLLPTATAAPVIPPTPDTLGTAAQPIVMALAPSATSQELQAGGDAIAKKLTELTGLSIKVIVPANYAATIEALGSGQAHLAFLAPLQYMKAKAEGYADVGLVVLRSGSDHYGFQIVANANRKSAQQRSNHTTMRLPTRTLRMPPQPWRSLIICAPVWLTRSQLPAMLSRWEYSPKLASRLKPRY